MLGSGFARLHGATSFTAKSFYQNEKKKKLMFHRCSDHEVSLACKTKSRMKNKDSLAEKNNLMGTIGYNHVHMCRVTTEHLSVIE